MVICDWTVVLVGLLTDWSTSRFPMFRVVKLQRLFRLFRTIRLIGGISHVFDSLELRVGCHSGMFGLVSQVVFIFSLFTWLNHLISCGMVAIGFYATADTGMSWMDTSIQSGRASFAESTRSYQYWTAMHWSMAQASVPGLVAVNTWERVACVWLRLVDKIFNLTLISALSATMVGVTMTSKKSVELRKLGQFLRTSGVTRRTAMRVRKAAIKRLSQTDVVREEQIPVVGQLSTGLRRELRFDMLGQRLLSLPVFNLWDTLGSSIMKDICFEAATYVNLLCDDHMYEDGVEAKGAYLVLCGQLSFVQHPEVSSVENFQEQDVEEDTWLCEAALWIRWVHVGSCKSKCDSQVVLIQANLLADVVSRHRRIRDLATAYAVAYHGKLVNCPHNLSEITDIAVPGTALEDVIGSMHQVARRALGYSAVAMELTRTRKKTPYWRSLTSLAHEVAHDKCFVFFNERRELRRVVCATAVRIRPTHDSNLFLAVLGWTECEDVTAECRLPESDRSGHTDWEDALAYLEDVELACLSNQLRILRVNDPVEGEWEDDRRFGVKTKHRRMVFELEFEGDLGSHGTRLSVGQDRRWNALREHLGDVFAVEARPSLSDSKTLFLTWMSQADFEAVGDSHNIPALRDLLRVWDEDVWKSVKPSSATCVSPSEPSRFHL